MQLRPEQLPASLESNGLAPLYIISGDEPLQTMEAGDRIRAAARAQDYDERIVLDVDAGFDWNSIFQHADSLSLFASRKLIDLRMASGKPGREGARVLTDYAARLPADTTLLISTARLDSRTRQGKWYKALEKAGIAIVVWPVSTDAMPQWIRNRMAGYGVSIDREAAEFIAGRVEGNLLAANQEIETLRLLTEGDNITLDDVMSAVSDNSRFDVFQLADAALAGKTSRTLRILRGLRAEGIEPPVVGWALTRELRLLARMSASNSSGMSLDRILAEYRIWNNRKNLVRAALSRHSPATLHRLLLLAGRLDRVIKGSLAGNPWDELAWLCSCISDRWFLATGAGAD